MRLKTLFFPIMLAISILIFIGYIWPEVTALGNANEDKIKKNQELQELDAKKTAIASMGDQILNGESEKAIKAYLPQNKVEERIINEINYLAGSANVSLVNITIGEDAKIPGAGAVPIATADSSVSELKSTSTKILISGEYEKIAVFLNGLHRLPIFGSVKSLLIGKEDALNESGEAVNGDNLLATIVVDFGYMDVASVNIQKVSTFNSNIDNETIDILKKYISQKAIAVNVSDDSKGKTNPFVAN